MYLYVRVCVSVDRTYFRWQKCSHNDAGGNYGDITSR